MVSGLLLTLISLKGDCYDERFIDSETGHLVFVKRLDWNKRNRDIIIVASKTEKEIMHASRILSPAVKQIYERLNVIVTK